MAWSGLLPVVLSLASIPLVARAEAQPSAKGETPAEWVKAHAIPLASAQAGQGFDDLDPLRAVIGDARIVGMGEPTHGTREAFQFKHRMFEFLVEKMGFNIFAIEGNMPEAAAISRYVQTGEGDPRKLIEGMYFWTWNTEEVFDMVQWMRAWNKAHPDRTPIQFTGFDMQNSNVASIIAHEFLKEHAPDLADRAEKAFKDAGTIGFDSGGPASAFGSATGTFPVADAKGKRLNFSVWIRTEDVSGWAGGWWRTDTPAGVGAFSNMEEKQIKGTTDWKRYEFALDVNADATNINFGFLLNGTGTAWFDDIEITLDGVPYANPEKFAFDFENEQVRYLGGGAPGYSIARVDTSPHSGKKCLQVKRNAGPALDGAKVVAEAQAIVDEMTKRQADLAAKSSAKDAAWAIQNARIVAQRARMFAAGMAEGSGVRDVCMADNVAWILENNPGQKVMLWAHNAHICKGLMWGSRWMGSYLDQKFPGQQVTIGFTTGSGTYSAVADMGTPQAKLKRDNVLQCPVEGSIEAIFSATGMPSFAVDLRKADPTASGSSWISEQLQIRSIGAGAMDAQFFPVVPRDIFDVLIWQSQTNASRPIPAP